MKIAEENYTPPKKEKKKKGNSFRKQTVLIKQEQELYKMGIKI